MRRPTWGDTVRVKDDAPPAMRPGQLAAVCGITEAKTPEQASQYGCAIGGTVFVIEFADGESSELSEELLEVATDGAEQPDD